MKEQDYLDSVIRKKQEKDVVKLVSHWRVLKVEGRWF